MSRHIDDGTEEESPPEVRPLSQPPPDDKSALVEETSEGTQQAN